MAGTKHLMDLSNELLLEIAVRVPFDTETWTSLSQVNQRFNKLMSTQVLKDRAPILQFPDEDALLPCPAHSTTTRVATCSEWSKRMLTHASKMVDDEDLQRLLGIAMIYLCTNECELRLSPWPEELEEFGSRAYHLRSQYLHLSILRKSPDQLQTIIRYFTIKVWQYCRSASMLPSLLGPEPEETKERNQWLCHACEFLNWELVTTMPRFATVPAMLYRLPSAPRHFGQRGGADGWSNLLRVLEETPLPIMRTGRILPSAAGLAEAAAILADYTGPTYDVPPGSRFFLVDSREANTGISENARNEMGEQMKRTRELVSLIEAPDGQYLRNLLEDLNLKAVRSTVTEQVARALTMSEEELEDALAKEIEMMT